MSLIAELMISGTLGLSGSLRLYLDALFDSLSLRGLETVGTSPAVPRFMRFSIMSYRFFSGRGTCSGGRSGRGA